MYISRHSYAKDETSHQLTVRAVLCVQELLNRIHSPLDCDVIASHADLATGHLVLEPCFHKANRLILGCRHRQNLVVIKVVAVLRATWGRNLNILLATNSGYSNAV